ncbi:hypothetical protein CesoFtcFv8_017726 [Champsocephalus esox]|uniref:Uncharacterized protein n=1 Tax=Champsocephalus esox TaxID=159716 RepID=A0AAN8BK20_9TELE|nr:hypothetical protein CesoFtcFv8_017726 [Champsocephalus esox]
MTLENLNLKYGNILNMLMMHELEMYILRMENQDLTEPKEPCEEVKDGEIDALLEENQDLTEPKESCEEVKDGEIDALLKENQDLTEPKEPCEEVKDGEIDALLEENQDLTEPKEPCEEVKDGGIDALLEENPDLTEPKEPCDEVKDGEIDALLEENQDLKEQKEPCDEVKDYMEIEQNVLRDDFENLTLRYGNLLKMQMKHKAEMDILRKENQDLRELKEPLVDHKDVEIVTFLRINRKLLVEKEEKDLEIARLREENRTLKLRFGVEEKEEEEGEEEE